MTIAIFVGCGIAAPALAEDVPYLQRTEIAFTYHPAAALCFTADGKHLGVGLNSLQDTSAGRNSIRFFDTAKLEESEGSADQNYHDAYKALTIAPDGRTWATITTSNYKVEIWDGITKKVREQIKIPGKVSHVAFLDKHTLILAGAAEGEPAKAEGLLKLWDTKEGKEITSFTDQKAPVVSLTLSRDQSQLITIDRDNKVRVWKVTKTTQGEYNFEQKTVLSEHKGVTCVAFSPDGKKILSGGTDKKVRLWEVSSGKQLAFFTGHADTIHAVAFTPDGKMPISWSGDGSARVWDLAKDEEAAVWKTEGFMTCFALSPDGTKLASGGTSGVLLWDIAKMAKGKSDK